MTASSDSALAGAVSGLSARLATTPLDVVKIRFQLQLEPIRRNTINVRPYIYLDIDLLLLSINVSTIIYIKLLLLLIICWYYMCV